MSSNNDTAKQLYEQYGFLIHRTCAGILHSEEDAKDALQIVFLKFLENYSKIRDKEKIVPWIFNAAKNHCYNVVRYNKKFLDAAHDEEHQDIDAFDEKFSSKEIIRLALCNHDKRVRDAVYYTYVEEFGQSEIQKLTGQSPATIRRNLKRFKDSLPNLRKRLAL
jgi:RNA polymerase sigma factor (sigma-70 family)